MEKPILLWDRSECHEITCTCHDDSSTPRFCTGCGCNVASPGHRNSLDVIDRQAERIRELEGALRMMVEQYGCVTRVTRGTDPEKNGDPYVAQARAALGKAVPHG